MSYLDPERRQLALARLRRLQTEIPAIAVRADLLAEALAEAQSEADELTADLDTPAPAPDPVP